jgi:hypothetical protein
MTLHIYKLAHTERLLVAELSPEAIQRLKPAFTEIEKRTGVLLSEYDDRTLYADYAQLLLEILSESSSGASATHPQIEALKAQLQAAATERYALRFVGE